MNFDIEIERQLNELAQALTGRLPDGDVASARYLFSKREWGVGLENLCTQIDEYDVELDSNEVQLLKNVSQKIGLDLKRFGFSF